MVYSMLYCREWISNSDKLNAFASMSINLLSTEVEYDFKVVVLIRLINMKIVGSGGGRGFELNTKNKFAAQGAVREIINNYNYEN